MTPTSRSLKLLRDEGWSLVEKVERKVPGTFITQDLFGFADIICVKDNRCMLVQTTSGSNLSARINKIAASPQARFWLLPPTRTIVCHGWARRGPRGKRKLWTCRIEEVTQEMLVS